MTDIQIARSDPRDPEAIALLEQSHALMQQLFDPEDNHYLEIDALCQPEVHFFTAKAFGKILGCAALAGKSGYGEIKSMFVDPESRGTGLADALMSALINDGQSQGFAAIKLETGDVLHAARRLYKRHGFEDCGPFGDYAESAASVFMSRAL